MNLNDLQNQHKISYLNKADFQTSDRDVNVLSAARNIIY